MTARPLTGAMRDDGRALSLAEYEAVGGYTALRRVLGEMTPKEVIQTVKDGKLRGRGGAGFPTAIKWSGVPTGENARRPKYFVCNADETEPGTFKDRVLLEGNPHLVLEGILIGAYAIEAEQSWMFVRWAYHESSRRFRHAIEEARDAGYLGENILGSGFSHDARVHVSAGRYMAGEDKALLESLSGRPAIPRESPPHLSAVGLWGLPTVVQNVETISNVPGLIAHGAEWFLALSKGEAGGTKIYGVSGRVRRPGWYELPLGTTGRELLMDAAGGMRDGVELRGFLPGGASSEFLGADRLDLPLDYDALKKVGSGLGTGCIVVQDDVTCPVGTLLSLQRFFARESCGWCTPCREGLSWVEKSLARMEAGDGTRGDLEALHHHCKLLKKGSTFCELAPGAMMSLRSAFELFGDDIERHVTERRCPWRRD